MPARHLGARAFAGGLCVMAVAVPVALGACGSRSGSGARTAPGASTTRAALTEQVTERDYPRLRFTDPTRIDNRWMPLAAGTQFILRGRANRGRVRLPHRVVFTVTDLTKVIDGVRTRVLWDRDFDGRQLLEGELTFHAQDDAGNVWNFGEYPEEYENGRLAGAPSTWIAGLAGAKAGVLMRSNPRPGTRSYHQGLAPAIDFADVARVHQRGLRSCVPVGCFDDVLVTDESNPVERGAHERKYYASGVGNIRVGAAGGREREVLVLERVRHLGAAEMAAVRRAALRMDRRAYTVRRALYGATHPAQGPAPGG